jgi:trimeric autotransporter adhesin
MAERGAVRNVRQWLFRFVWLFVSGLLSAAEYHGQVFFNGLPVPGASVTVRKGITKLTAITDEGGAYQFPDLPEGDWTVEVTMTGFSRVTQNVTVTSATPTAKWDLTILSTDQIMSQAVLPESEPTEAAQPTPPDTDLQAEAQEGLLVNGSVNNGAASRFTQDAAFGNNNRRRTSALYTGGIGMIFDNSTLDATPFSLTGQSTPKPSYNDLTGTLTFGGPFKIPHLVRNGPNFFVGYQTARDRNAVTQTALVPSASQRNGLLSVPVFDPLTGIYFPANTIPQNRISPQAQALLALYPMPNFTGNSRYNYQVPAIAATHQDALQSRLDKMINGKNQLSGSFAFQSVRSDSPNVLGYSDSGSALGINSRVNWTHRLSPGLFLNLGYQFSRYSTHTTPFFANRVNISGNAGIQGNNQDPVNWGPPTLIFSSGIVSLTDALPASNHSQTSSESLSLEWNHHTQTITVGGDYRREQFNYLSQQNPRGAFSFTGAATGSDIGDFLLGTPDTSSIAFGNADKYFRQPLYDGYANDDWRVNASFTLNAGLRWEYSAPMTELYNRLVNLDVTPGFTQASPVLASNPIGPLTDQHLPNSLVRPDRSKWEPRVGLAWRALSGSGLVVRAGYGNYANTSIYQSIAVQLAQQPPLSKTLAVQNTSADPLTLANGFRASPLTVSNTFAIDPNFRVGYAQNWQLSVQRDLPGSLVLLATYSGIKGTRGLQEFLPNTFPIGAPNPCPVCSFGYTYLTSNGNSTREAAQIQLRRRLHSGFTATVQYTFSKSLDNVAILGGQGPTTTSSSIASNPTARNPAPESNQSSTIVSASTAETPSIAQNWLNLSAERGRSTFDQRHLLSAQFQYTSGMGIKGGALLNGWKGALLKEWTLAGLITVGTGLPLDPIYLAAVPGTGFTGTIRPIYTGASLYGGPSGLALNPAAFTAPVTGQWGNAGRNIITGPSQFALNATLGRTFRLRDRLNLDLRFDATNALNHVTYTSWNTIINNAQFGLPVSANSMRRVQTVLRLRF